jgi:Reverse transcriptase (RNA-dependent DNA polymerase)
MAAAEDMELHQINIKGAYLNGELTERETIYMAQPPGYPTPNSAGKVC